MTVGSDPQRAARASAWGRELRMAEPQPPFTKAEIESCMKKMDAFMQSLNAREVQLFASFLDKGGAGEVKGYSAQHPATAGDADIQGYVYVKNGRVQTYMQTRFGDFGRKPDHGDHVLAHTKNF
jgi:hypothetical protein